MKHWILTANGNQFNFQDLESNTIAFDDIAQALSKIGRFTGHCNKFYSVAQHSVIVADRVTLPPFSRTFAYRAALLHDASEAYLGDVSHPLKSLETMVGYRMLEDKVQTLIYRRLLAGYPTRDLAEEIKTRDIEALHAEGMALLPDHPEWALCQNPAPFAMPEILGPEDAEQLFREAWESGGQRL
jgi:hypothetical protein